MIQIIRSSGRGVLCFLPFLSWFCFTFVYFWSVPYLSLLFLVLFIACLVGLVSTSGRAVKGFAAEVHGVLQASAGEPPPCAQDCPASGVIHIRHNVGRDDTTKYPYLVHTKLIRQADIPSRSWPAVRGCCGGSDLYSTGPTQETCPRSFRFYGSHAAT